MVSFPIVGNSRDAWGGILNFLLGVGHNNPGGAHKLPLVHANEYMTCDASTDVITPLQNLANAVAGQADIIVPYPGIKTSPGFVLPHFCSIRAAQVPSNNAPFDHGVLWLGTDNSQPIMALPKPSLADLLAGTYNYQQGGIYGFTMAGGKDCIDASGGVTDFHWEDLNLYPGPGGAGILIKEFNQYLYRRNVRVVGGDYGVYYGKSGRANELSAMDKCRFVLDRFEGQAKSGEYVDVLNSTDVIHELPTTLHSVEHGNYLAGQLNRWLWVLPSYEANGFLPGAPVGWSNPTTGTIASGANLVIADRTGGAGGTAWAAGDFFTIKGGGPNADDFTAYANNVAPGSGTTATVLMYDGFPSGSPKPINTPVVNADVVRGKYCDVKTGVGSTGGVPQGMTWIMGGYGNQEAPGSMLQYGMDLAVGTNHRLLFPDVIGRPIHHVGNATIYAGEQSGDWLRCPNNIADAITGVLSGTPTATQVAAVLQQLLARMEAHGQLLDQTT